MKIWAILLGLVLIVVTHLYMLTAALPEAVKNQHAVIMLATAALIAYGAFTH